MGGHVDIAAQIGIGRLAVSFEAAVVVIGQSTIMGMLFGLHLPLTFGGFYTEPDTSSNIRILQRQTESTG